MKTMHLIKAAILLALAAPIASQAVSVEKPVRPVYLDPLSLYVRTTWPEDISSVGEAARYVLEPTGYRFVVNYPAPSDAAKVATRKLTPTVKIHRTMPIIDALQLLVGQDGIVVVDHDHRLVSFTEKR